MQLVKIRDDGEQAAGLTLLAVITAFHLDGIPAAPLTKRHGRQTPPPSLTELTCSGLPIGRSWSWALA